MTSQYDVESISMVGDSTAPAGSPKEAYEQQYAAYTDGINGLTPSSSYGVYSNYEWIFCQTSCIDLLSTQVKINQSQYLDDINKLQTDSSKLYKQINEMMGRSKPSGKINGSDPSTWVISSNDAKTFAANFNAVLKDIQSIDAGFDANGSMGTPGGDGSDLNQYFTDADIQSDYKSVIGDLANNLNAIGGMPSLAADGTTLDSTTTTGTKFYLGTDIEQAFNTGDTSGLQQTLQGAWQNHYDTVQGQGDGGKTVAKGPDEFGQMINGGANSNNGFSFYKNTYGTGGESSTGFDDFVNTELATQIQNVQSDLSTYTQEINQEYNTAGQTVNYLDKLNTQLVSNQKIQ